MRNYQITGSADTGTNKTVLTLVSGTSTQPLINQFSISSGATPAENTAIWRLARFTAAGTEASGFTPLPLNPNSIATNADGGVGAFSVEPTYTANAILFQLAVHMRASYTWNAKPGLEFWLPSTTANGAGLYTLSATTAYAAVCNMIFQD